MTAAAPVDRPGRVGAAAYADAECAAGHHRRAGRHRHRPGRAGRTVLRQPVGGARCRRTSGAGGRHRRDRARPAVSRSPTSAATGTASMCRSPGLRGWAMYNKHFWLQRRFRGVPAVLLRADVFRAAFDQADRGLPGLVGGHRSGDAGRRDRRVDWGWTAPSARPVEADCRRVRCPVAVLHGTDDRIRPFAIGERLAELTGGSLLAVEGAGHALPAREPVLVNRVIGDLVRATGITGSLDAATGAGRRSARSQRATWVRAPGRPRRALYPVLADRARARPAGRRHRPGIASAAAGCRDRLAGTASGHPGAARSRRADPPGLGGAAQRISPYRE